ncbi:hypothetical protein D3C84_981590 [compost metagenome]
MVDLLPPLGLHLIELGPGFVEHVRYGGLPGHEHTGAVFTAGLYILSVCRSIFAGMLTQAITKVAEHGLPSEQTAKGTFKQPPLAGHHPDQVLVQLTQG